MSDIRAIKDELAELLDERHRLELNECLDAFDVTSRPTSAQQAFLEGIHKWAVRWAVCSNRSGKTAVGGRECAWIFQDNHPTFKRPKEWGTAPLTMIVMGRVGEQIESEIWAKKIEPFLKPGSYKPVRSGNALQRVINLENGNVIIFLSHHHAEEAREKAQAFTAQWVWVDEMPGSARLISELVMRTVTSGGRFIGTFTPLVRNIEIKRQVDNADGVVAQRFNFLLADNPAFADRLDFILKQIRDISTSEAEYRCRVFGEWMAPGTAVYKYDEDRHWKVLPTYYNKMWRHVVVVDPAASGQAGLAVFAEDPIVKLWYCTKAKYIKGDAAYVLVQQVEDEVKSLNVVRRVCDSNPSGYYKEALRQQITYIPVMDKQYKKDEFIEAVNTALAQDNIAFAPGSDTLAEELVAAAWSETGELRIIGGSRFHTADCLQYFLKNKPAPEAHPRGLMTPMQALRASHKEQAAETAKKQTRARIRRRLYGRR